MILLFAVAIGNSCVSHKNERSIIVIHSYEKSYAGYPDFDRMIAKEFKKQGINAIIHTAYLDCENLLEQQEIERINSLLDSLSAFSPEIILVNDDQATYSLLKSGHPLTNSLPIVFAGVNYPNYQLIEQHPNVTGFNDAMDIVENMKVATEVAKAKISMIIADFTFLDKKIRADLDAQFIKEINVYERKNGLPLTKVGDYNAQFKIYEAYKKRIIPDYIILQMRTGDNRFNDLLWRFSKFGSMHSYIQTKRDFTILNVTKIISGPAFTAINEAFGYNEFFVGGYFTPMRIQAEDQVRVASAILRGRSPSDFVITEHQKEYWLDWKNMEYRGISLKDVNTAKYNIANITLRERYPIPFYSVMTLIILIIIIIVAYSITMYILESQKRKKTMLSLQREQSFFTMAITGSNTFAWRWEEGHFYFSEEFMHYISQPSLENRVLSSDTLMSYIHPEDRKKALKIIADYDKKGNNAILQLRANFSGIFEWWEVRNSCIDLSNGESGQVGLFINIQAIKEREKELEQAREMAENAEMKQSFLANMSHEIRTPLNSIVGFSNIIASGDLSEEERVEYIDIINSNTKTLLKIINDVLEISRLESGHMSLEIENFPASEIYNSAYSSNQISVPKNIQFVREEIDLTQYFINVDKVRLSQVINNFINNAFKFTPNGYVKLGARIYQQSHEIEIYVEDTGIGIDEAHQKMIFARFYKQSEFSQGTGLGLSICKVIAEKMNGHISLRSEKGKGSTFAIVLPLA